MSDEPYDDRTTDVLILTAGAKIGQYEITSRLGAGGMAEVFLAEDTRLRRKVALKFLSPQYAGDAEFRKRFMREAQSAAVLNHPNIITIHEVSEIADRAFIAMEYVEGRSLRELIDGGELSPERTVDIAVQVCDGLAAAHSAGVVHRDIKPGNIIVGSDGRVRLLDFGLAKAEGDEQLTKAGTTMGTVDYMSPEQGQGLEADARSDVFSIGILLYELLAGKLPFKRANVPATIYAIVHDEPEPINGSVPGLTDQLQSVITRALCKKPADRYENARDLVDELRAAAGLSSFSRISLTGVPVPEAVVKSLAVLYLKNLGPQDDEYISYGITEDLIIDLTRLGTIRVAPMRTILKYKDSDDDLEAIAERLKVTLVLDGSIMRSGNSIRVSAQLVDVTRNENLWAERWEEPLESLPAIKRSLAEGISMAVGVGMTMFAAAGAGQPDAEDAAAYDKYLQGKYAFDHKQDKADVDIALGLLRQALKEEPSLLAAKAGTAEILAHQGRFDEARTELDDALIQAEKTSARPDQANLLRLQAKLFIRQSDWDDAWKCATRALDTSVSLKDIAGEADSLGVQISILQPQGRFDEALEKFDRVLEIARDLDDQDKVAEVLKNMGVAYSRKGDYDRALGMYEEALDTAEKSENLSLQAACLANIGNLNLFRGDLAGALTFYQNSLDISERIGDRSGIARQSLNVGLAKFQKGELREGLGLLQVASKAFADLGERTYHAMSLANMGQAELFLGEIEPAQKHLQEALQIGQETKYPLAEIVARHRLGSTYLIAEDYAAAREQYEKALELASGGGMTRNEAIIHLDLARLAYATGDLDECKVQVERAQVLAREIGDKPALCIAAATLGLLEARTGLFRIGLRQIEHQAQIAREIKDLHIMIHVQSMLGEAMYLFGKDKDKEEGERILKDTLALAREREFNPEADRIERLFAASND